MSRLATFIAPGPARHRWAARAGAFALLLPGLAVVVGVDAPPAHASSSGTVTYTPADGLAEFLVPTGVFSVTITAVGASGGDGAGGAGSRGAPGGLGDTVTMTMPVTPGTQLFVAAGAAGGAGGGGGTSGFNALGLGGGRGGVPGLAEGGGGGAGGASAVITVTHTWLVVAGGGGGGGGGGAVVRYDGGLGGGGGLSGGNGSGLGAGAGGSGFCPPGPCQNAPAGAPFDFGGGAGGGGGGYSGGVPGAPGAAGGGGGGGGGGGQSEAALSSATFAPASAAGNGWVTLSWQSGVLIGLQALAATRNPAYSGLPVTFTDTVTPYGTGLPAPSGTVTFSSYDVDTALSTPLATERLVSGVATWTTASLPVGTTYLYGAYSGDGNYVASNSVFLNEVIVPSVAPSISGVPPAATAGSPYGYQFTATGAPTPTEGVQGSLPPGLTLSWWGYLSGVPTTTGTYSFAVTANNGVGSPASQPVTMVVAPGAPVSLALSPSSTTIASHQTRILQRVS